jgi:hypothetical protein
MLSIKAVRVILCAEKSISDLSDTVDELRLAELSL